MLGGNGMNGQIQSLERQVRAPSKIKINVVGCLRELVRTGPLVRSRIAHALSAPRSPSADVASAVSFIVPLAYLSLSLSPYFSMCSLSLLLYRHAAHKHALEYVRIRVRVHSSIPSSSFPSPTTFLILLSLSLSFMLSQPPPNSFVSF